MSKNKNTSFFTFLNIITKYNDFKSGDVYLLYTPQLLYLYNCIMYYEELSNQNDLLDYISEIKTVKNKYYKLTITFKKNKVKNKVLLENLITGTNPLITSNDSIYRVKYDDTDTNINVSITGVLNQAKNDDLDITH